MKILRIHLSLTAQNAPVIANNLTDHTLRIIYRIIKNLKFKKINEVGIDCINYIKSKEIRLTC